MSLAAVLLLSLCISLLVTPGVRSIARARGALDWAHSSRKVHGRPVPRFGGLGIVAGTYGALGLGLLASGSLRAAMISDGRRMAGLALAGLVVAGLGFYDDLRGTGARKKLGIQFGAALLLYWAGFRIDHIDNPLGGDFAMGALSLPLTLLWIAGVSNAVNLIDGLDGLAGGICLAGALTALAIGAHAGDVPTMLMAVALAGGIAGFLVFNVNPASIFMGDTGSLFLGVMLAALALRPDQAGARDVPLLSMALALGIPLADTAIAVVRRAARGAPLFDADRGHIHHRLLDRGLSHRQAVFALWAATGLLSGAGAYLVCGHTLRAAVLVLTVLGGGTVLYALGMLPAPGEEMMELRRENRARLRAVRGVAGLLRRAAHAGDLEHALGAAAAALGARAVKLGRWKPQRVQVAGGAGRPAGPSRFPLNSARPRQGVLEVEWREPGAVDRDREIACELLCRNVARAVARMDAAPVRNRALPRRGAEA